jgi:hypothetical protein
VSRSFDELIDEAADAPIHGWDFTWLESRATEERPPWHYSGQLADRMRRFRARVDAGGERLFRLRRHVEQHDVTRAVDAVYSVCPPTPCMMPSAGGDTQHPFRCPLISMGCSYRLGCPDVATLKR